MKRLIHFTHRPNVLRPLGLVSLLGLTVPVHAQIVAPGDSIAGQSQLQLAERYLQWQARQPFAQNPFFTKDPAIFLPIGDQGDVFFLSYHPPEQIALPADRPIFMPLAYGLNNNMALFGDSPTTFTAAELLGFMDGFLDGYSFSVTFDGVSIPNLQTYRQTTDPNHPYTVYLPSSDNLYTALGADATFGTAIYPTTVPLEVQDGIWLGFEPLEPGSKHTLIVVIEDLTSHVVTTTTTEITTITKSVPDAGSPILLLGLGLGGIVALRQGVRKPSGRLAKNSSPI
ncbi:MAG TPA: hypothetical protein PLX89_21300 [Verrucomicrobiota bacterium]|nr:hypothetical protein [Verrucomicrobiota bacterium]